LIKLILVLSLYFLAINARENPFFNLNGVSIPITSNTEKKLPSLKQASITLPSTARVIEGFTVNYKSLDGSKHSKSIVLENAIDWHLPLFISQSYNKQKTVKQTTYKKNAKYKKISSLKFISFYENGKNFKIITKDSMIRHFLLVNPHRIVVDFKRDMNFKTYSKQITTNTYFSKIRLGNHDGYYRIVIELDGYYAYRIQNKNNNYIFKLK